MYINFSALYLSIKRLTEVVDQNTIGTASGLGSISAVPTDGLQRVALIAAFEEATIRWLNEASFPTLGELIISGKLSPGAFFTHYGSFYGKGITDSAARFDEGKPLKQIPIIHTKLDTYYNGANIIMQAHPENFTSISARVEFSGRKRLFVVARLTKSKLPTLSAQAYAIGHLHEGKRKQILLTDRFNRLNWQMEVFCTQIECFMKADDISRPMKGALKRLSKISEARIKKAFAEIVDEPFIPKDWGGERSDLYSTNVILQGERVATAFAFKGPSKFKPLTVADLGKNGDQISRLFSEPADLFILQHCHQITSAVRDHMRAFATRINRLRPFTLIDGADTIRILKAYKKLSF